MMFPLVLDLATDKIPVAVTCRVLGFSKQAFYQWKAAPVSQRDWDDAHLLTPRSTSITTTPSSATGSSPTNSPPAASRPAATGSTGCAPSSDCGRSTPASAAVAASPDRPFTTTWCAASSPRQR
jgi:hypothetical protein